MKQFGLIPVIPQPCIPKKVNNSLPFDRVDSSENTDWNPFLILACHMIVPVFSGCM